MALEPTDICMCVHSGQSHRDADFHGDTACTLCSCRAFKPVLRAQKLAHMDSADVCAHLDSTIREFEVKLANPRLTQAMRDHYTRRILALKHARRSV